MERNDLKKEVEIDLNELLAVLLGKMWIIIMVGIGFLFAAFLLSKFAIEPIYRSTTKIYVLNKQDSESAVTYNDLQSGTQLTKDYMTLVTSRPVTEQVIAEVGLEMKHEELVKHISVSNPTDTRILEITVKYNDPFIAKKIADASREISEAYITNVMDIEQVNVVEEANIPENASEPNYVRNSLLGGVFGTMIAVFIILLKFFMNDTIKTPEDIEKYLGLSVLSTIPLQLDAEELDKNARKRKKEKKKKKHYK